LQSLGAGDGFEARYRLADEIARGGMGAIIGAADLRLGRRLALKVMLEPERAPPELVVRFVEEAQIQGQLEHPNICPVYELGLDDGGRPFFAMKRVKGRSLAQLLKAGELSLHRRLDVFLKVCDAVAFAHARGVIHRDIKPDNVMVGEFGEVLLMDWGIAKVVGQPERDAVLPTARGEDGDPLTMIGGAIGTPHFMSPEQARGDADVDARTDVYALGGVLYQILTGQRPVQGKSLPLLLKAVQDNAIVPPRERAPDAGVPRDLEAACMRALAGRRDDRYAQVEDLADDIRAFIEGRALSAVQYTLPERIAKWYGRNRTFARMAIFASVVAVIGAGALAFQREQTRVERRAGAERGLQAAEERLQGGQWAEAWRAFEQLGPELAEVGASPRPAEVGRWRAERWVPPALFEWSAGGAVADLYFVDDRRLAVASGEDVVIQDLATGGEVGRFEVATGRIQRLAVSPDRARLLAVTSSSAVAVWDLAHAGQPAQVAKVRRLQDAIFLTPGALAVSDGLGALRVDLAAPERTERLPGLEARALTVGPGGTLFGLFKQGLDAVEPRAEGAKRGRLLFTEGSAMAVDPRGELVVLGLESGQLVDASLRFHTTEARALFSLPELVSAERRVHRGRVVHVEMDADGARWLSQDALGRTLIWARKAEQPELELPTGPGDVARLSPDGRLVAVGSGSTVRVFGLERSGSFAALKPHPTRRLGATSLAPMAGGLIAVSSYAGVELLFADTFAPAALYTDALGPYPTPGPPGYGVVVPHEVGQDGRHTVRRSKQGVVVSDLMGGAPRALEYPRGMKEVPQVAFVMPGGERVLLGGPTVDTWVVQVATGSVSVARDLNLPPKTAASADGRYVILDAKGDGLVRYEVATGAAGPRMIGQGDATWAVALSADGRRVWAAGAGGRLVASDAETGAQLAVLRQDDTMQARLALSPDGRMLAVETGSGHVLLLDPATGATLAEVPHEGAVADLRFSPARADELWLLSQEGQVLRVRLPDFERTPAADLAGRVARLAEAGLSNLACRGAEALPPERVPLGVAASCATDRAGKARLRPALYAAQAADKVPPALAKVLFESLGQSAAAEDTNGMGEGPLHRAVYRGDVAAVKAALAGGADPNEKRDDGRTVLGSGALLGHRSVVEVLLAAGADPNLGNPPPLDAAILSGDAEMLRLLMDAGAQPSVTTSPHGHAASLAGELGARGATLMDMLLTRAPAKRDTLDVLLVSAVVNQDHPAVLDTLLRHGADPNVMFVNGQRALHMALTNKDRGTLARLLAAQANPNLPDKQGLTPLVMAVEGKDLGASALLLGAGADPNLIAGTGALPLVRAVELEGLAVVDTLLEGGADPTRVDAWGRTPMQAALRLSGVVTIAHLVHAGASPDEVDGLGVSLLRRAVRMQRADTVLALLRLGARDLPGADGVRARDEAERMGAADLVALFAETP
ncbi:MAG: ankyrin repeat domain-containing protein, partial [Myxococcales bacterium]|nr:ankyrin repeat domain-containing protein [Myxococcales bacterium]